MIFPQTTFRDFHEESTFKMRNLGYLSLTLAAHISHSQSPDQGPDLNHKKNVSCYRTSGVGLLSRQTQGGEFNRSLNESLTK